LRSRNGPIRYLGIEYRHITYGHYRTIFRVEGSRVIILRVIHGARLLDFEIFEKWSENKK